jgi:hypothetical protein
MDDNPEYKWVFTLGKTITSLVLQTLFYSYNYINLNYINL